MKYRRMKRGEEHAVSALARRVFDRTVAPDMSPEGNDEFRRYASPAAIAGRILTGHLVLVADDGETLRGMLEIRQGRHVAMLFVERPGEGTGGELMRRAVEHCRRETPGLDLITVNAAPGAVDAYRRMGFRAEGGPRTLNGITFIPMSLALD